MIYYLFDFDKTLFNSLDPDILNFFNRNLKINGYDDPNSIPLDRDYISGKSLGEPGESWNEQIVNIAKKEIKNSKKFLITGRPRTKEFMKTVIQFLRKNGIQFDGYYFGYNHIKPEKSKQFALEKIIDRFGEPEKVYFFDDNSKFLHDFENYFITKNPKPNYKIFVNNVIDGVIDKNKQINEKKINRPRKKMKRRWSIKYKKKINCNRPKGFSQKQYCKRKKRGGKYISEINKLIKLKKLKEILLLLEADPKVGTGKKPKGSKRRLYTDENPKDTVRIKFRTVTDIKNTLSKSSFKSKSHARKSQIINLIHQRVRAAYRNAKDPDVKKRLKRGLIYIEKRRKASKEKTKRMRQK